MDPSSKARFAPTRWSLVQRARHDDPAGRRALAELCELYWPPVYAFFRRDGLGRDEALDLTQGLFADLLERGDVAGSDGAQGDEGQANAAQTNAAQTNAAQANAARPAPRGRFRSYLLACAKHYAANERDRGRALKRGGGRQQLPFDIVMREDDAGHSLEPSDTRSPEQAYTRAWVRQATEQALARLEAQEETKGRAAAFELLRPALEGEGQDYAGIAATLGSSEGAIKVAAHRLRKRYRELLLEELGATVETAAEAEIELAELLADLE